MVRHDDEWIVFNAEGFMSKRFSTLLYLPCLLWIGNVLAKDPEPHNAVIFVADGLRGSMVNAQTAPTMDALRREGVAFPNSHSLYPTVTTANASAIATGHYLGDTGDFANSLYVGFSAVNAAGNRSVTPFIEDDVVLGELDHHFDGDYLNETTLLAAARARGFSTAAIGKLGPTLIMDHTERSGEKTLFIDDKTGIVNGLNDGLEGIALTSEITEALKAAHLPVTPPAADKPNSMQQDYLVDVTAQVVLPLLRKRGKPFVLVFWSRDPDFTQHSQLDSRYGLVPGINGSTSLAAIRNADTSLKRLRDALHTLGLDRSTDIFVTSDHGFSTISKQSDTSQAARRTYENLPAGFLPPGFLALDVAGLLDLPLFDPDNYNQRVEADKGQRPRNGNGLIGRDAEHADLAIAANGGSDLIYALSDAGKSYLPVVINGLLAQDYTGGLFVDHELGRFPGTIPLSAVNLHGSARTPRPSIIVNFRSFSTGCDAPLRCGAEIADSTLQQGQGMHGSFSRADTYNFMAATGPSFRKRFNDPAPVSNADIVPTLARILDIPLVSKGKLVGRSIEEALLGGKLPAFSAETCLYSASSLGHGPNQDQPPLLKLQPALKLQRVGTTLYFDSGGLIGRVLGLNAQDQNAAVACDRFTEESISISSDNR